MTNPHAAIANVLHLIDREVWIVTATADERRGGLCATWVSVASLAPERPVMLIGIAPNHATAELIDCSGVFGLHLLLPEQTELALHFACGSSRDRDKLAGLTLETATTGVPLLGDALAWLDCQVFARYHAGDRLFYWADVVASKRLAEGVPLREKQLFAAASSEIKKQLLANRDAEANDLPCCV